MKNKKEVKNNVAVVYARVSSKEQEETGYSLPAQEKSIAEYGLRKYYDINKVFSIAESASGAKQRKVFSEMMVYMSENNINILLCEKVDRITRNFKEAVVINDWIEEDDERQIHFVKQNLVIHKYAKSDEKFRWDIEIVLAKKYISNLSEEVKKGQAEKISQGWLPTKPPLGYKTVGDKGHKIHVIDEPVAVHIIKMFKLYATGNYSTEAISDKMYKLGFRSRAGGKVHKSRIHVLLKYPFYYGKFMWNGKKYDGKHKPLISKKVFDEVQSKLSTGVSSPYYSKLLKNLQGKITCGSCGKMVTWEKQKKHLYGGCKQCKSQLDKKKKYIKQEVLEDELFAKLVRIAPKNEKVLQLLSKALKESHSEDTAHYEATKIGLLNQSTRIQQRMSEMYNDKLDRRITAEMYDEKLITFKDDVEDISHALKELENGNVYHYESGFAIHELAMSAYEIYNSQKATTEDRRLLLSYSFSNISVSQGNIRTEYTKAFQFLADWIPPINDALELEETLGNKGQKTPFGVLHPTMLRR